MKPKVQPQMLYALSISTPQNSHSCYISSKMLIVFSVMKCQKMTNNSWHYESNDVRMGVFS
jgi:hypothetical protein